MEERRVAQADYSPLDVGIFAVAGTWKLPKIGPVKPLKLQSTYVKGVLTVIGLRQPSGSPEARAQQPHVFGHADLRKSG